MAVYTPEVVLLVQLAVLQDRSLNVTNVDLRFRSVFTI
jgi:hypothetical protein